MNLKKSKIALISHPYFIKKDTGRGHDRYAYELIKNLKKSGINPSIVHSGFIKSIPEGAIKELFFPFRLFPLQADLYHATATVCARAPIWLKKKPLVVTIHDLIPLAFRGKYDFGFKYQYKTYCVKLAVTKSDRVIVPFLSTKKRLMELYNVPPRKIKIIKYGVDHENFFPERIKKGKEKIVFFVGEATRSKGVDSLILAFKEVLKKIKKIRLKIGSSGRELENLKRLSKKLGLDKKVEFLGFIPENKLRYYYNQADISVFPSRYGFGLPTLEAMACGTPTISGKTLDAVDFINDGSGILINPNNIESLAQTIIQILSNQKLAHKLSIKGLKKAQQYTWDKSIRETIKVYRELL